MIIVYLIVRLKIRWKAWKTEVDLDVMGLCTRPIDLAVAFREAIAVKPRSVSRLVRSRWYSIPARTSYRASSNCNDYHSRLTAFSGAMAESVPRLRSQAVNGRAMHSQSRDHRAFIALGSNMGDRIDWIEQACNAMESRGDIRVLRTSSLWETKAMYVLDQANFVNGACEVRPTYHVLRSCRSFLKVP